LTNILVVDGLVKSFGAKRVLNGASLALPVATTTGLIGPSASGKSVLMKCAAGLLTIDDGRIGLFGHREVGNWSDLRSRIGILFQRNALFDGMRVWENVAFALRRRGASKDISKAEAKRLLALVGLDERAALGWPKDLSGGMQKRAAFARAIAGEPELLLLDDPTAGLDPVLAASVEQLIRHIVQKERSTALIVTADVHNLKERFDYVAILDNGVVQWAGSSRDVPSDAHPLLAAA
jgi:phospholipid/cholesterol/gamma-HCH transport system ATP-binding protein